jgi:hypothetical protein
MSTNQNQRGSTTHNCPECNMPIKTIHNRPGTVTSESSPGENPNPLECWCREWTLEEIKQCLT